MLTRRASSVPPASLAALVPLAALAALSLAGVACRRAVDEEPLDRAPRATSSGPPVDRLGQGELTAGPDRAMGVPLPRGTIVQTTTPGLVLAYCDEDPRFVDAFLRAQAPGGTESAAGGGVTRAPIPSPADPAKLLEIHTNRVAGERGLRIAVRDVTPMPKKDLPDDEARLREVGLTKDGRLLNPTQVQ